MIVMIIMKCRLMHSPENFDAAGITQSEVTRNKSRYDKDTLLSSFRLCSVCILKTTVKYINKPDKQALSKKVIWRDMVVLKFDINDVMEF